MTAQNPDNARSVTKYTGQNYTFTPAYRRSRDPTAQDLRDPLNQGYYPFTALWINKTNQNLWSLVDISNNVATWILLGGSTHPQIQFLGGLTTAGFPVDPDAFGHVTLESTSGTITLTGNNATNSISFDLTGGGASVLQIGVDDFVPPGTNPVLPTGLGQIDILGVVATAGAIPIQTISRAANEFNIEVQKSAATAVATPNSNGISHFNSAQFTVTADAFVSLIGGPSPPIMKFDVDANTPPGTDPVVADAGGIVTITGAQVATGIIGANVIRTNSLLANTYTIEIQRSTAVAAADSTKNGVSHFFSTQFTVDADGFVTLAGSTGPAITKVNVDANTAPGTDPVIPDASGVITVTGGQVATGVVGANVIRTDSLAANTYTIEIQRSTAVAASDVTKNGVSHFNSADFTVDGNGFVSATGGFNPGTTVQVFEDFLQFVSPVASIGNYAWRVSGFQGISAIDNGHPGLVKNQGVFAGAVDFLALLGTNNTPFILGGGEISYNWVFKINTLSTGAIRYILRIGMGDNIVGGADFTNGVYFEYSDNLNAGQWIIKTATGGVRTSVNTATAVATGYVNLGMVVNAAGTSVAYTVNGVAVAGSPIATNIPTTNPIGPLFQISPQAGLTADSSIYVDLFYLTQTLTVSR